MAAPATAQPRRNKLGSRSTDARDHPDRVRHRRRAAAGRDRAAEIGANEVLVEVRAAGLDRGTWHLMAGSPTPRVSVGLRRPRTRCPVSTSPGVVVAVGSEVTRFQPGDEVFGVSKGSFAEFAAARERQAGAQALEPHLRAGRSRAGIGDDRPARTDRRRPPGGWPEGPDHRRLWRCRQLRRADRQGAGSRSHRRLQHRKLDLVRSLGADHVIDYTPDDFADGDDALRPDPRHRRQLDVARLRRALTRRRARSSSSAAKAETAGSAWAANYARSPSHRSSANGSPCFAPKEPTPSTPTN